MHIHLVECSPTLQKLQYSTLKCEDEDISDSNNEKKTISTLTGAAVSWHSTLEQVPLGCMESKNLFPLLQIKLHDFDVFF